MEEICLLPIPPMMLNSTQSFPLTEDLYPLISYIKTLSYLEDCTLF